MTEQQDRSRKSKMKRRPLAWDERKIEIAQELGLWEKVQKEGWAALSASESGRLGGILASRYPGPAPKLPPKNQAQTEAQKNDQSKPNNS
jgi:small acid-soluble spore protein F (minor alpha/beta-type SASP)